jgi:soluble lytic murein transglycosylase-like protein
MHSFMKWQLFVVLGLLSLCAPVYADIYAFVDSKGVTHISNIRDDPRYQMIMRTPEYRPPQKPVPSSYAPSKSANWRNPSLWNGILNGGQPFVIDEDNRKRYAADVARIAAHYKLDPALMHAVISAESAYNPRAVSEKGAMGLMQLMPDTAKRFGIQNPYDPIANMHGGARYLRWLINRFNNTTLALAAYNAGEGAVENYGNSIPPYGETQTYVARVLKFYNYYRQVY